MQVLEEGLLFPPGWEQVEQHCSGWVKRSPLLLPWPSTGWLKERMKQNSTALCFTQGGISIAFALFSTSVAPPVLRRPVWWFTGAQVGLRDPPVHFWQLSRIFYCLSSACQSVLLGEKPNQVKFQFGLNPVTGWKMVSLTSLHINRNTSRIISNVRLMVCKYALSILEYVRLQ